MTYIPGDFYRICEVCGFKKRRSETRKRWDGYIVCLEDYEERHPQDYVRGIADRQNVPEPRPEPTTALVGPLTTLLAADAAIRATSLTVQSSVRFGPSDRIGVIMANGETGMATLLAVPDANTLTLVSGLPYRALEGAIVINYSAVAEADIG